MKRGIVVLILLAGVLGGCGEPAEETAVESEVTTHFTSLKAAVYCGGISDGLRTRIYGSRNRCERLAKSKFELALQADLGPSASATATEVDGDTARTKVTVYIQNFELSGHVRYIREADKWRLAEIEPDYMRASFELENDVFKQSALVPALAHKDVKDCLKNKLDEKSDASLKAYYYGLEGQRRNALLSESAELNSCVPADGNGSSGTRQMFEAGMKLGFESEQTDTRVGDCVIARTRSLSEKDIAELTLATSDEDPRIQRLTKLITAAFESCGAAVT